MFIRIKRPLVLFPIFMALSFRVIAQTIDPVAYSKYKCINKTINLIENDSVSLQPFYEKLYQLEQHATKRVSIVHIGDSHLQADFFSGAVRQKIQLKFGNAGRGLIFPYRVAKSNEPASYKTTTNKPWEYKRNSYPKSQLPMGISGFTIETADTSAKINLTVKDQPGLGYAFTKFSLFHDKGLNNYDITVCDETNCERIIYKSTDSAVNPFVSELRFDSPMQQIMLKSETRAADTLKQKHTRIYGMLLENDSAGVLYNTIGVNGAEYRHYNMSQYFIDQLKYLKSDLVIISLGTNDGYNIGFNPAEFYNHIDTLVTKIKTSNPTASIILTTPPDSFRKTRRSRIKNPDMNKARATIVNYSLQHKLAYWDFYEIMGGFGSMAKWYALGLAAKDRIHFTPKGYLIQGDLFYNALINGYDNYKKNKAK